MIITDEESVIAVECLFANFSDPKGCYVVLECTSDNINEHKFNLSVQENRILVKLEISVAKVKDA